MTCIIPDGHETWAASLHIVRISFSSIGGSKSEGVEFWISV